jgi:hypothetical protein
MLVGWIPNRIVTEMLPRVLSIFVLLLLSTIPTLAQDREAAARARFPYDKMAAQVPGLTMQDYETAIRIFAQMPDLVAEVAKLPIRPLAVSPSASPSPSTALGLVNPQPPRPAVPPVPRITYPTTRGTYEWEAAHLRR